MASATVDSLPSLLASLTSSISSAAPSLPAATNDDSSTATILPPADGISLLDTKSELLLSYLQNLVFLIVVQLRHLQSAQSQQGGTKDNADETLRDEVVKKLTELKVYLERGVRPLEARLKYQVDKVLKAAEDAERAQARASATRKAKEAGNNGSESDSGSGSGSDSSEESEADEDEIDELAYRPNLAAFSSKAQEEAEKERTKGKTTSDTGDGIYRPPRIKPTALPTADKGDRRAEREARRTAKSRVIDEFVNAEMSSAPVAEPSIGSTIKEGGRRMQSNREREEQTERRTYEENNFVRLPQVSKKEQARKRAQNGREGGFGGEDWRGLTEGADRIERLTRRTKGSGSSALDKSRKRRLTEDGPRGDGADIGESFEKRRKKISGWKR